MLKLGSSRFDAAMAELNCLDFRVDQTVVIARFELKLVIRVCIRSNFCTGMSHTRSLGAKSVMVVGVADMRPGAGGLLIKSIEIVWKERKQ